jgi:hypothetical protein
MNRVTFIPKNKDGTKGKALSMTSFFRCLPDAIDPCGARTT